MKHAAAAAVLAACGSSAPAPPAAPTVISVQDCVVGVTGQALYTIQFWSDGTETRELMPFNRARGCF